MTLSSIRAKFRAVSEVLARVTTRTLMRHAVPMWCTAFRVPRAWLESGEVVEFELPRNLSCAACDGGGCDSCERSGRGHLARAGKSRPRFCRSRCPRANPSRTGEARGVVIRIPEQGGLPPEQAQALPRGLLLLRVELADVADAGVSRVVQPEPPESHERLSLRMIPKPSRQQLRLLAVAVAIVLLAGIAILYISAVSWG